MGKAVICSQVPGQTDVIQHGLNGYYVCAEDPAALHQAILDLLQNPDVAEQMGHQGRRLVEEQMNLKHYVGGLAQYVQKAEYTSSG